MATSGCTNRRHTPSQEVIRFYKISSSKKSLLWQRWLHNIRCKLPLPKDSSFYICAVHFDETCFKRNLQVNNFIISSRKNTFIFIIFVISVFTKIFFLCLFFYLFELFTNLSSLLFNSSRNRKTIFKQKYHVLKHLFLCLVWLKKFSIWNRRCSWRNIYKVKSHSLFYLGWADERWE